MNESDWLACTDPTPMLECLRGKASDRKLRLLGCACCRRCWHLLIDERSRAVVEIAESLADEKCREEDIQSVVDAACDAAGYVARTENNERSRAADGAVWCASMNDSVEGKENAVRYAMTNALLALFPECDGEKELALQADLLREIIGNPFRSITLNPSWLTSTVQRLAESIYQERAFDRLPVLADALEEAGCQEADILGHCRQPGQHVPGCWVLDLLLGKE